MRVRRNTECLYQARPVIDLGSGAGEDDEFTFCEGGFYFIHQFRIKLQRGLRDDACVLNRQFFAFRKSSYPLNIPAQGFSFFIGDAHAAIFV